MYIRQVTKYRQGIGCFLPPTVRSRAEPSRNMYMNPPMNRKIGSIDQALSLEMREVKTTKQEEVVAP